MVLCSSGGRSAQMTPGAGINRSWAVGVAILSGRATSTSNRSPSGTCGHLRAFLVHLQSAIADEETSRKPSNSEGRTLADLTLHGYAQVIKPLCRWLYREELLDKDPSARLAMPKVGAYV